MNSTNHDENESPPSEDEDRSLLFGPPKEGTEPAGDRQKPRRAGASASPPPSRTSPPAAEAVAEPSDPAGRAGPAASSDAVQRRILALLEDLEKKVAGPAAARPILPRRPGPSLSRSPRRPSGSTAPRRRFRISWRRPASRSKG